MSGIRSPQPVLKRQNSQLSEDDFEDESTSKDAPRPAYLPAIWEDDVRMNALFSDFRAKNLNPAAFEGKMKFWTDVIDACVVHEDLVTFTAADLREKLQRKGRQPHCIPRVLEEMHKARKFVTVDEFFSAAQESWVAWGFDSLLKKPLSWSAGFIFGSISSIGSIGSVGSAGLVGSAGSENERNEKVQFVSLDLIRVKAGDIIERAESGILSSSVLDLATFKEIFGDLISASAVPIVLKQLQRTQQVLVTDLDDEEHATIKFLGKTKEKKNVGISETDRGVIALRRSLLKMEKEAKMMEKKIEELDEEIRFLLREGKKPVALRVLKKKKLLEKALNAKDVVIGNISGMLEKLENSENDTKVFEAYKAGLSALKKTQQDTSLEKIEGIVDEIQETVDVQNEIEEAVNFSLRGTRADDVDEDELERELKELLADDPTGNLIAELENLKVADSEPSTGSPMSSGVAKNKPRDTFLQKGKAGSSQT